MEMQTSAASRFRRFSTRTCSCFLFVVLFRYNINLLIDAPTNVNKSLKQFQIEADMILLCSTAAVVVAIAVDEPGVVDF